MSLSPRGKELLNKVQNVIKQSDMPGDVGVVIVLVDFKDKVFHAGGSPNLRISQVPYILNQAAASIETTNQKRRDDIQKN